MEAGCGEYSDAWAQARAAIMEGVDAGLSQRRISRLMGSSPSVALRAIARHTGPDAVYLTEDARYGAQRVVLG